MVCRLNRAEPQVSETCEPSSDHLDRLGRQAAADVGEQPAGDEGPALVGDLGRERGAGRGLVVEASRAPAPVVGLASISRPARTGTLGRTGRLRAAQATASASTSRSTRNFTSWCPPTSELRSGLCILPCGWSAWGSCTPGRRGVRRRSRGGCPQVGTPGGCSPDDRSMWRSVVVVAAVESVDNLRRAQVRCGCSPCTGRCGRRRVPTRSPVWTTTPGPRPACRSVHRSSARSRSSVPSAPAIRPQARVGHRRSLGLRPGGPAS